MAMTEIECSGGNREMKHVVLDRAICNQEEIVFRLNRLLDKIVPPRPQQVKEECKKDPQPSLSHILDYGAERLEKIHDESIEIINQIEMILF